MTRRTPDTTIPLHDAPAPLPRRRRSRRGTVLLFALGVLAVISVAAVSYVTFVRVDRNSSAAAARTVGYDSQVDRVVEEIAAHIAADLWGNKLVTTDVPSDVDAPGQSDRPIWPKMFEDGEFRDYPFANFATFDTDLPGQKGSSTVDNSVLAIDEAAPPDDAWLAPVDPIWIQPGLGASDRTHWRQITNLRSVYRYDTNGTPNRLTDDRWVRGDGKFVDLGQLFLDARTIGSEERGNPGTNLLDKSIFGTGSPHGAVLPRNAAGTFADARYQLMPFASGDGNPEFTPSDERFWADTDGDLRADARWQLIDSLGTAEGLLWVTATRIIDLSALVNFNSAIEGGYGATQAALFAEGRTPADVDLYRLLLNDPEEFNRMGIASRRVDWGALTPHGEPRTNWLTGASSTNGGTFSDHLTQRLRIIDLTNEIDDPDPSVPQFELGQNWYWAPNTGSARRLTWTQRLAMWNTLGSAPGRGTAITSERGPIQPGYDLSDMIDLHAFSGANNRSILSKWEQTIDGRDTAAGFLPRPEDEPGDPVGPLRSRTRPGDTRYVGSLANGSDSRPAPQQIRGDVRRLLTAVSGVTAVSPVPSINAKAVVGWDGSRPYYNRRFNTKIRLSDFTAESIPDAFQSFVWALAPLATDEPLTAMNHARAGALVGNNIHGGLLTTDTWFHYGGPDYLNGPSPAVGFGLTAGTQSVEYGENSGAAFAVVTSAALATNLADASDNDDIPSVSRLFVPRDNESPLRSRTLGGVNGRAILGNRFSHGDIPQKILPELSVGQRASSIVGFEQAADNVDLAGIDQWLRDQDDLGLTLVGMERHPYITEVFAFALFENVGGVNDVITVTNKGSQVGAVIAVQLANPYPTPITIGGEYEITILQPGKDDMAATGDDAPLRLAVPSGFDIDRNAPVTLLYTYYDDTRGIDYSSVLGINADDLDGEEISTFATAVDRRIAGATEAHPVKMVLLPDSEDLVEDNPAFVVPFAGEPLRIALRRQVPGLATAGSTKPALAVIDYMESEGEFFPESIVNTAGSINLRTYFQRPYFENVGYDFNAPVPFGQDELDKLNNGAINGRIGFTSAVSRPMKRANFGGFPAYMVATRPTDIRVFSSVALTDVFGHAWLVPIDTVSPAVPSAVDGTTGFPIDLMLSVPGAGQGIHDVADLEQMHELEVLPLPLTKNADTITGGIPDRPIGGGWQVFIPNRPLRYVSELHQLCTYAHLCKDNQLSNIAAWTTVGQQLRESLAWDFAPTSNTNDNPYIGTLDPSRFLPVDPDATFTEGGYLRDDSLALPLALRVFDCFEALDYPDALAQGRININTAPERVLQMLPHMAPGDSTLDAPLPPSNDRPTLVLRYRDGWDPNFALSDNEFFTNRSDRLLSLGDNTFGDPLKPPVIRRHDDSHNPTAFGPNVQYPFTRGFATAGELAFLDSWFARGDINGFAPIKGFLSPLGTDGVDNGSNDVDARLFEGEVGAAVEFDGIADDPEERLALYRAVSNIVSSRSDVYAAWFILRGYDPKVIETIVVDDSLPENQRVRQAMDIGETPFLPTYESRWFVIFDRSNCRTPTDRPRILLKAQLPSSRP